MRKVEAVLLGLGLALFLVLLDRVGWGEILRQFRQIGWAFLLVVGVSAGRYLARTAAWRRAFPGRSDTPSFGQMFQAKLAGESLTYLSVAGPLLGEPTRATLLRERLPLVVGLGGTLIEVGVYALTAGLVTLAGLVLGLLRVTLEAPLERAGWLGVVVLGLALVAAWALLRRQVHFLSAGLGWASRGRLGRWLEPRRSHLVQIEEQMLRFYSRNARDFRAVFLWDCLAQVFALLEIYVILGALGLEVGLAELLILEALTKVIKALFFFVPGRVGTDEGGIGVVFQALGFGLARGVGLALVRRLRAMVWSAAGLFFLSRYALRRTV